MSKSKEILHIYIRVSTGGQEKDGTSLDSQLKLGKAKAKSLGMDYEVHDERSASSSKEDLENRPIIKELLARIAEGEIKHIYVYSIDRLSRNTSTSTFIRETLRKAKCTLYTNSNETNLDSLEQNLLFGIISEISQYENMLRRERLTYGRRVKARQGYWMGGPTPFGYKVNKNKKLVLDPKENIWVEKMFEWYSKGVSSKKIKHKLDGNIPTRRGNLLWSYGSVDSVLRNTHHNGYYVVFNTHIKCPRGIDEILYEKVHRRMKRSIRHTTKGDNKWKDENTNIRNLLVCGHCNREMGGRTRNGKRVYQCIKHNNKWKELPNNEPYKRQKYCINNVSVDSNRVEDGIWETLLGIMKESHHIREEFKQKSLSNRNKSNKQRNKDIKELSIKRDRLKENIQDVEDTIVLKDIERVGSREKESMINKTIKLLQVKHDDLTTDLNNIEIEITSLKNKDLWVDWVSDYDKYIDESVGKPRQEKIELVRKYLNKVNIFFDPETRLHQMDLDLKLKLVNDSLNYKDQNKKRKGYDIGEGHNHLKVDMDYNVRNVRT